MMGQHLQVKDRSIYNQIGAGLNPGFSIEHKWIDTNRRLNLWFHDRFHVLLSLSFKSLVTFLVLAEAGWAAFLSLFLAVITKVN